MATISRVYRAVATIVNADTFTNTEEYSSDVDLETDGYEGSHITASVAFHASGTADAILNLYGSLDGSTYDTIALASIRVPITAGGTKQVSFVIADILHWRLGYITSAAEASYPPTLTAKEQSWRWQSA